MKFVAFHHSIYSSGTSSNTRIRGNLVPLFDKYGVDVVFMGHAHDYERTKPLKAAKVVKPDQGTVYVTTGGGGFGTSSVGRSSFTAYAESAFHFTRVAVDGGSLSLEMVREDGSVRDRMGLAKVQPQVGENCGDGIVQTGEDCEPPATADCDIACRRLSCPTSCDDGDPCTDDGCDTGRCRHLTLPGCCRTEADCDDGDPCTADGCEPTGGVCRHAPIPGCCGSEADCDNGSPCAIDPTSDAPLLAACTAHAVPPGVARLLARAQRSVERLARTQDAKRVQRRVRAVAERMKAVSRRVARARDQGRIAAECAGALIEVGARWESRAACMAAH